MIATMKPRLDNFTVPFEGQAHAATWMCWPLSEREWRSHLNGARSEFAAFVEAVAEVEQVELICGTSEAEADAQRRLSSRTQENVRFHRIKLDDVWFRDNGPIFVARNTSHGVEVAATVWTFNAWGGKYRFAQDSLASRAVCELIGSRPYEGPLTLEGGALEFDGQGTGMTTLPCLLGPTRNPGMSQGAIEEILCDYFGTTKWIWLDYGLQGDHTDGHIDTLARFTAPGQAVACSSNSDDSNYHGLRGNKRILEEAGVEVLDLPIPVVARYESGLRLPETYCNYYLANGRVIVPQYGDVNDEPALAILRAAFPDREVIGLSSRSIINGGGSFHCLSQQQPKGTLCGSP